MSHPIITLTTDFGTSSSYAGAMKGVMLGICPEATIVDISHDVPPQDIAYGAFVIACASPYFPSGTVHVCVVDPGVGTARRALLVVTPSGRFLVPDNGLITLVLEGLSELDSTTKAPIPDEAGFLDPFTAPLPSDYSAYVLARRELWRKPVSETFHGRDIFAPIAAHVARGARPESLGEAVGETVRLSIPRPLKLGSTLEGRIIFIDHFGNLVSNIRSTDLPEGRIMVEVQGRRISGLSRTYAGCEELLALIGSHGYLEIAEPMGSAARSLRAEVGAPIRLTASGGTSKG